MAFLISDLDAQYTPLDDEKIVLLSLRRLPSGYALKAVTPEGRDIGRWVSDCPLTASIHAMLWLGQSSWKVKQSKDSMPINKILEEVPGLAPRGAHPQIALDMLRTCFPPKPNESATTGAQIDLSDPEEISLTRRGGAPLALTGPVAAPIADPALLTPVAPPPAPVDHGGVDPVAFNQILREAVKDLKEVLRTNGNAGDPIDKLLIGLGVEDGARPSYRGIDGAMTARITNALIAEIKRLAAGDSALVVYRDVLKGLGVRLSEDGAATNSIEDELAEVDELIAAASQAEPKYRVLMPGDPLPANLTPEQVAMIEASTIDDPALREKIARTHERAAREHSRINRAIQSRTAAAVAQQVAATAPAALSPAAAAPAPAARRALPAPPMIPPPSVRTAPVAIERRPAAATSAPSRDGHSPSRDGFSPPGPSVTTDGVSPVNGSSSLAAGIAEGLFEEEEEEIAVPGEGNGLGEGLPS